MYVVFPVIASKFIIFGLNDEFNQKFGFYTDNGAVAIWDNFLHI